MIFSRSSTDLRATKTEKFSCWDQLTCHGELTNYMLRRSSCFANLIFFLQKKREIDQAFLRRFERKILIDVPSFNERQNIIKHFLPSSKNWKMDVIEELSLLSENFTGDDIRVAIKEANMMIIRKKIMNSASEKPSSISDLDVEFHHLKDALRQIKPNPEHDITKHRRWNSSCGKTWKVFSSSFLCSNQKKIFLRK